MRRQWCKRHHNVLIVIDTLSQTPCNKIRKRKRRKRNQNKKKRETNDDNEEDSDDKKEKKEREEKEVIQRDSDIILKREKVRAVTGTGRDRDKAAHVAF